MPPKKAVGKAVVKAKKVVETIKQKPFLKTYINAGMASPAPPLGTQLAQKQVIATFSISLEIVSWNWLLLAKREGEG